MEDVAQVHRDGKERARRQDKNPVFLFLKMLLLQGFKQRKKQAEQRHGKPRTSLSYQPPQAATLTFRVLLTPNHPAHKG